MIATGDPAKLSDQAAAPPITVTGANLDYQFEDATVQATGDATLIQGDDRMTAERISYDLDADRAQAFSGDSSVCASPCSPRRIDRILPYEALMIAPKGQRGRGQRSLRSEGCRKAAGPATNGPG